VTAYFVEHGASRGRAAEAHDQRPRFVRIASGAESEGHLALASLLEREGHLKRRAGVERRPGSSR
jgi:hypothetical protein